jgi:ATP-dependent Zn protease
LQGRVAILKVHARGKALAKDIDFDKIARRTPGFTGADLQNLMNEAAIMAARRNLKEISKEEVADALERIVAGPEKVRSHPSATAMLEVVSVLKNCKSKELHLNDKELAVRS